MSRGFHWRPLASLVVLLLGAVSVPAAWGLAAVPFRDVPRETWYPDARVNALAVSGDRVFIGGDFSRLRNPATGAWVSRSRLAAVDATTGELVAEFDVPVDDRVWDLQLSADGSVLYVGGDFTTVAGVPRSRVAAVDATTGALIQSWDPGVVGTRVSDMEILGNRLFIGGSFGRIAGSGQSTLAAVDTSTGSLVRAWRPKVTGGLVTALALSPTGDRLYVGGRFDALNGVSQPYLGAVDPVDGATLPWAPPPHCAHDTNPCYVWDLDASDPLRVYAAVAGPGGEAIGYDVVTGRELWSLHGDGNVQAIAYADGVVYAGGHFDPKFGGTLRTQIGAIDAAGGQLLPWAPRLLRPKPGIWDIVVTSDRLLLGGAFDADGVNQQRYAQMERLP